MARRRRRRKRLDDALSRWERDGTAVVIAPMAWLGALRVRAIDSGCPVWEVERALRDHLGWTSRQILSVGFGLSAVKVDDLRTIGLALDVEPGELVEGPRLTNRRPIITATPPC
jgi:hypothetical protein